MSGSGCLEPVGCLLAEMLCAADYECATGWHRSPADTVSAVEDCVSEFPGAAKALQSMLSGCLFIVSRFGEADFL